METNGMGQGSFGSAGSIEDLLHVHPGRAANRAELIHDVVPGESRTVIQYNLDGIRHAACAGKIIASGDLPQIHVGRYIADICLGDVLHEPTGSVSYTHLTLP